jgi:hypothetical protein
MHEEFGWVNIDRNTWMKAMCALLRVDSYARANVDSATLTFLNHLKFCYLVQIWDFKSGGLIETIPFPSEKGAFLYCARYLSDDMIAAGGSGTKNLKLIYRHTHEVICVIPFIHQ